MIGDGGDGGWVVGDGGWVVGVEALGGGRGPRRVRQADGSPSAQVVYATVRHTPTHAYKVGMRPAERYAYFLTGVHPRRQPSAEDDGTKPLIGWAAHRVQKSAADVEYETALALAVASLDQAIEGREDVLAAIRALFPTAPEARATARCRHSHQAPGPILNPKPPTSRPQPQTESPNPNPSGQPAPAPHPTPHPHSPTRTCSSPGTRATSCWSARRRRSVGAARAPERCSVTPLSSARCAPSSRDCCAAAADDGAGAHGVASGPSIWRTSQCRPPRFGRCARRCARGARRSSGGRRLRNCPSRSTRNGCNYLFSMAHDAAFLPAPTLHDPLLLRWFTKGVGCIRGDGTRPTPGADACPSPAIAAQFGLRGVRARQRATTARMAASIPWR